MEITNFTGRRIRIGGFPTILDVTSIPGYHSDDGLMCYVYLPDLDEKARMLLIQSEYSKHEIVVAIVKWDEQIKALPKGKVLFDSKLYKQEAK